MIDKIKVTLLFDKKNNWLFPFFERLKFDNRFRVVFSDNPAEVRDEDVVFILGYTKILGEDFLNTNSNCLVVHESDLPKGKGFAPVQWQILEGKNEIPISLLVASNEVDSGDIVLKQKFKLTGTELYSDMRKAQGKATVKIVQTFLDIYPNFTKTKQSGEPSFYPRRKKADSELDIDKSIADQFNLLRIANNEEWPAFFFYEGKKFILKVYEDKEEN